MQALGCVVGANDAAVADELSSNIKFRADQRAAFQRLRLLTKADGHDSAASSHGHGANEPAAGHDSRIHSSTCG